MPCVELIPPILRIVCVLKTNTTDRPNAMCRINPSNTSHNTDSLHSLDSAHRPHRPHRPHSINILRIHFFINIDNIKI